ncbi:hypothetical protein QCE63_07935 [Caballeronia sp. LZ065]|uniref:hypothetical protein n=1 Tax=Caballeronia sp. LZ065 TaxID=3038571 RepID=UPI002864CE9C|nr:hypothetical protein [Caballeronia sp. LZ065]MDR5779358.1 hypothetical protein [Caballeronia sp. LZ065]
MRIIECMSPPLRMRACVMNRKALLGATLSEARVARTDQFDGVAAFAHCNHLLQRADFLPAPAFR